MNDSNSQTAYGVFKPVGHVLASFPSERDARSAVDALKQAGFPDVAFYPAEEVRERAERDIANAGVLAGIGQELNLVKQQRELAEKGHPFVSVLAAEDEAARRVADIVVRHNADRAQKFGRLIIEELIEPGTARRQTNESPDTGLDAQTRSELGVSYPWRCAPLAAHETGGVILRAASGTEVGLFLVPRTRVSVGPAA